MYRRLVGTHDLIREIGLLTAYPSIILFFMSCDKFPMGRGNLSCVTDHEGHGGYLAERTYISKPFTLPSQSSSTPNSDES